MDNVLTWNVRNWITVVLMVMLGWLVITAAGRLILGKQVSGPANQSGYMPLAVGG